MRWDAAKKLGPAKMNPWRLQIAPIVRFRELYPEYDATASLLDGMDLPPDFEAEGPIRYTHRRTEGLDMYFVANREPKTIKADCTFRIAGRQPELWDPLTGAIRDLPEYTEQGGRTTVPMRFEPHQSFFVVFREESGAERLESRVQSEKSRAGKNFPEFQPVGQIEGPWAVSFDPRLGGPQQVTFAALENWSRRSEPGINYYSGIATYRKTFDLPTGAQLDDRPILLDLGEVHSMARVRLNERDMGVVWCAPWRVDITNVVRARENRLEIEVANLWPNRLIGDKALPPDEQVAWTTFNPYQADSPLLPSGLLGPVTLKAPKAENKE
jgi:hypothetical protein